MTDDRDGGEEPHPVRSKFIFVSQQRIAAELLDRIKQSMRTYPIDQIPDESLPRLVVRLHDCGIVLATLEDCAPFMSTSPLDTDELWRVLTRLLTVPGGPLVASDGTLVAPFLTDLLWHVAARSEDTVTLADISLVAVFTDGMGYVNLHHAEQRVGFEAMCALAQAYRLRWWAHARRLLETAARRNCGDAMLAGVPEGGEP